jgi:glycosyltransferase involved in cell wall biosynthesis
MPQTTPWVTIGIPTYNRPELLRQALERLTRQTYRNIQFVVSDNCSPDEASVREVVESFSRSDSRVRYVRQKENIGAIRNLKYLLDHAEHDFFMWAADDDILEETYVEKLVDALIANPECSLAMTGHDVVDRMSKPEITVNFNKYIKQLPSQDLFMRLLRYILQPEYYGKIRILWGLGRTRHFRLAFDATLAALSPGQEPKWHVLPVEMRMLLQGNLCVVDDTLFHAQLLPTSDGKSQSSGSLAQIKKMCHESFQAYSKVIDEASLSKSRKLILKAALEAQRIHALARVIPFYSLQEKFPEVARMTKYIWFKVLVR